MYRWKITKHHTSKLTDQHFSFGHEKDILVDKCGSTLDLIVFFIASSTGFLAHVYILHPQSYSESGLGFV